MNTTSPIPMNVVCASYARFSSNTQNADSVADQQRKLRNYAEKQGWTILPELEFGDEAISGTKRDRPGLNALMAAARDKLFNVLLFESLSRFARQSAIAIPLLKELTDICGVRIISMNDSLDSANAQLWNMCLSMLSSYHEQFIADLSKFVFRGQEAALLSGYALPDTRFGYGVEDIPGTQVGHGKTARCRKRYIVSRGEPDEIADPTSEGG